MTEWTVAPVVETRSDPASVHTRIVEIFADELNLDIPDAGLDLIESGLLDSLTFVELLMHLERAFGLIIAGDALEIENFRTVARIAAFVIGQTG